MTAAIIFNGIQKLWNLLSQVYEQVNAVEHQVTELKRKLELLSSFVKDANAKKHTSAVVRKIVEQIKEIIYDAEDTIETFLQKEKLRKTGNIITRVASIIPGHRKIASKIEGISKTISNVTGELEKYGVQKTIADEGHIVQPLPGRQTFPKDHENVFVGMEANVKTIVGYLVAKEDIQIVSVTGMGGLGKTTLARQVFNHQSVKDHFRRFAWVCVSQEFTRISVWQTILQNLSSKKRKDEILRMKEAELQDEIYRLLETSRSLIVIDDIWKEEDWDQLKPIFPPKKGWKVLLTSRNNNVAMGRNTTYVNFKPECLNTSDSWTLLQRIAMPRKDTSKFKTDKEMEEMGMQMVKHCGGLPLAIKALGGLLNAKYTVHDWKRLSANIGSHIATGRTSGNNNSIDCILSMSYEELPSYLKHCFLYLAHFPEDYPMDVEKLSYYWAAEGIFEPRHYDGETIQDIGDSYIEELVRRNMVNSKRDVKTLRFKICHLHDMMREVCLLKAKEENFLQIAGTRSQTTNSQSPGTSRRFVSHNPTTLHVERDITNQKLRSLLIVFGKSWMVSSLSFTRLKLLRVLDLFKAEFDGGKLPSDIGKLIHLRYLNLEKAKVTHLPSSLGNLLLLIYLNIKVYMGSISVPNVLMGMQDLRYLALPGDMHENTMLELSNLDKLETLENFSTKNSSVKDLQGMTRLETLSISFKGDGCTMETLSLFLSKLKHLEDLTIDGYKSDKEGFVLDCFHLKQVHLNMYMPKLPDKQHFPSHLTTLFLANCGLVEDPMPVLEKLLHLKEVNLTDQSFVGKRMVCSSSGFPQLEELVLYGLHAWEDWKVEKGSMPLLHTLTIWNCGKLKELPLGMQFISSLQKLRIYAAPMEFNEKLSTNGVDYYKIKHIPSVEF